VNSIETCDELRIECKGVGLNERKRVVRLGLNINAYNLESGPIVT
jgi:hypothetical protein